MSTRWDSTRMNWIDHHENHAAQKEYIQNNLRQNRRLQLGTYKFSTINMLRVSYNLFFLVIQNKHMIQTTARLWVVFKLFLLPNTKLFPAFFPFFCVVRFSVQSTEKERKKKSEAKDLTRQKVWNILMAVFSNNVAKKFIMEHCSTSNCVFIWIEFKYDKEKKMEIELRCIENPHS